MRRAIPGFRFRWSGPRSCGPPGLDLGSENLGVKVEGEGDLVVGVDPSAVVVAGRRVVGALGTQPLCDDRQNGHDGGTGGDLTGLLHVALREVHEDSRVDRFHRRFHEPVGQGLWCGRGSHRDSVRTIRSAANVSTPNVWVTRTRSPNCSTWSTPADQVSPRRITSPGLRAFAHLVVI